MIKLSQGAGFQLIPEGVTIFKITEVEYKEEYGKMTVTLQTQSGAKQTERFTLISASTGEINEKALNAFSYFAKTALNNFSAEEIDEQELVGKYIQATVKHEKFESNKEPGKMLKSARLSDYAVALGFTTDSSQPSSQPSKPVDLDSFLDD